jgi:gamma-glutamyltranspeptidase/glutathione hydrolase
VSASNWRERAGTLFTCEKQPAHGTKGVVVTNHPLGSAAGMEMLAAGGNAVDAAVAAQFALTVVEPMMVGLIGGTTCHIRLADGTHTVIDGMSAVPLAGSTATSRCSSAATTGRWRGSRRAPPAG